VEARLLSTIPDGQLDPREHRALSSSSSADALPGEDKTEAMRELLTASVCYEVEAVGEEAFRAAITLIEKVVDRIADDARAAADLAGAARHRPC
jgi:hypothetical protein